MRSPLLLKGSALAGGLRFLEVSIRLCHKFILHSDVGRYVATDYEEGRGWLSLLLILGNFVS